MATYIQTLQEQLADLEKQKKAAYDDLQAKRSLENEYKRQYTEKAGENDGKNAQYIAKYWLGPATINREAAESAYNEIVKIVQAKIEQLDAARENPQAQQEQTVAFEAKILQAKTEASRAMQGTTKYLIWGAVALVIVIGAIIILRKKLAA